MQIRKSSMKGDKPLCHIDAGHKVYYHCCYDRYADCSNKSLKVIILRFLCVRCHRTISVLPDDLLPYRSVPVKLVEKHFDARANGTPEPAATENEKGCLKRAWARFKGRVEPLIAVLGQIVEKVKPNATALWQQLRRGSNLPQILYRLAEPFKTSLLGDYLCLKAWKP